MKKGPQRGLFSFQRNGWNGPPHIFSPCGTGRMERKWRNGAFADKNNRFIRRQNPRSKMNVIETTVGISRTGNRIQL